MKAAPSPEIEIPVGAAPVFENFIAAEYAYFSPNGDPLCWPVTPYWYPERGVLAIATGLAYPNKADYAAVDPHVALLFSDPTGSGVPGAPQVFVRGIATVLDEDVQANTDRYVRELREKFLAARWGLNPITVKFLDFYLPRLWVEVTPTSIELREPRPRASSPHPGGRDSQEIPASPLTEIEGEKLRRVVAEHGEGVVITRGPDGHPSMERVSLEPAGEGIVIIGSPDLAEPVRLEAPASPSLQESGYQSHRASTGAAPSTGATPTRAALSIHHHTLGGTSFRAYMVRGQLLHENDVTWLVAERLVGFFGNGFVFPLSVIPEIARLRRRLRKELVRRGWQMPRLRVP